MMHNSLLAHQQTKDFEEFLRVENLIRQEFENGITEKLLETLRDVYKNGSDFVRSGELMKVLLQGREMLKDGQE